MRLVARYFSWQALKGPTLSFASIFYKGSTNDWRKLFYKNVTHTPFSKTIFTIKGKMESSTELWREKINCNHFWIHEDFCGYHFVRIIILENIWNEMYCWLEFFSKTQYNIGSLIINVSNIWKQICISCSYASNSTTRSIWEMRTPSNEGFVLHL